MSAFKIVKQSAIAMVGGKKKPPKNTVFNGFRSRFQICNWLGSKDLLVINKLAMAY